ncbi:MAG: HEAT repeat domain-containing protein [Verrucomicrobia bacterium]|nr:HEAT repeat domain-containing protein [Verrucomicrobiota bacterium]
MPKSTSTLVGLAAVLGAAVFCVSGQTVVPVTKAQEAKLIAVLKSDAPRKEKADACRLLALVGTKDAVPVLAGLLADEELNHMARYALEPIPEPAVDEALRAALATLKGRPLVGVIGSLGVRRDFNAVGPLAPLLNAPDVEVARAAARALGSIGTPTAAEALMKALPTTPAGSLLDVCEGSFRCAETLHAQGQHQPAGAIYDRLLATPGTPHQVRGGALRGAILTRGRDGVDVLKEYLRSKDYILFSAAVQTAQELPGLDVTQALGAELGRLPDDHAILVIQTLGTRGDAAAVPALATAATSAPKPVRLAALRSLPMLRGSAAAPVLVTHIGDADREVAGAAQEGLASLPGKETDDVVLGMLNSPDKRHKLAAIELIERRYMTAAVPALLNAAANADPQIRTAALRRVGSLGSSADLPKLLDVFASLSRPDDLDAAEQALNGLCGKHQNAEACAQQLTASLRNAQPAQTPTLLRVLSVVGGPVALKTVRAAVADTNADIRTAAIRALGAWKTADAAPDLLELARSAPNATDQTLCLRSYLGLASNADIPVGQRLHMCQQAAELARRTDEKKMLLSALGSLPAPKTCSLILPHLDDPAVKEEAAAAIVAVADKLLNRKDANKVAASLVSPLEKVAQTTANQELAKRANALAQQAKTKAGQ